MRLISWNVMRGGHRVGQQVNALAELNPDIVALQEMSVSAVDEYRRELRSNGFAFVEDSLSHHTEPELLTGPRRYGVLIASKYHMEVSRNGFDIPWAERTLSVSMQICGRSLGLHTAYIPPGSSNGWVKIETLEGIYEAFSRPVQRPRILCGDFNTPQLETKDGNVVTWAQRITPNGTIKLKPSLGERWDLGERNVLQDLEHYDLHDVFRLLHGYRVEEYSWFLKRKGNSIGRRFDHVFASLATCPVRCRYIHELRLQGLSDHSPIEVCFAFEQ